jgi:Uma2 family endonuclease
VRTETIAPWAEPVLVTADELLRLPEDGWRYELVEGRLVRMTPAGIRHGEIVLLLGGAVLDLVRKHDLGRVVGAEAGFRLSPPGAPDTVLAPDVAFVRAGRIEPAAPEWEKFPRLAPDLVVEIASPSQGHAVMQAKVERWLEAGVRLVWTVFPDARTVEVRRGGGPVSTVGPGEELEGEDVLPGFVYPVAELFR